MTTDTLIEEIVILKRALSVPRPIDARTRTLWERELAEYIAELSRRIK